MTDIKSGRDTKIRELDFEEKLAGEFHNQDAR